MSRSSLLFIPVLTLALACGGEPQLSGDSAGEAQPAAAQAAQPTDDGGVAPMTSDATGEVPEATAGEAFTAAGLTCNAPQGWQIVPGSGMRLLEAAIPGDAGAAQLTIFFFGAGGGGDVEANLQRWMGQVEATSAPQRDSFTSGQLTVHWVEVEGTLKASQMGTGPSSPQADSRLLGAVIEGPGGPWFFKATGPATTLAAEHDHFLGLLSSCQLG